jgi:transposase
MLRPYRDITDDEWRRVTPLLPELQPRREARGRPLSDTRAVLNGALWVMFSGASWSTMPRKYPSYQTCHRRFKNWHDAGVLERVVLHLFGASSEVFCEVIRSRMRPPSEPSRCRHAAKSAAAADARGALRSSSRRQRR